MKIMAGLFIGLFFAGVQMNASAQQQQFKYKEHIKLVPEKAVKGPDQLKIVLKGYGHKIGKDAYSFLELEVSHIEESQVLRVETPLRSKETRSWKEWEFVFLKCDDNGPPHSNKSMTEIMVDRKPTPR